MFLTEESFFVFMKNCEKSSQALANAEDLRYNEPITIPNSVLRIM